MKQKYWLAENGEVKCLDDRCPEDCDMNCPIYLQTIAVPYLQNGHFAEAAKYLKDAVKIEPTFAEAWNNLAACYGSMGDHKSAYEAYLKSFDLIPKQKPLYGMAVAAKNMGRPALAMQYVAMYEKRFGKDDKITALTAEIAENKLTSQIEGTKEKTLVTGTTAGKAANQVPDNDMRKYGESYLLLLDQSTREKGYEELEKIESRFPEAGIPLGLYYLGDDPDLARKHFKIAADAGIAEGLWSYSQLLPHSYVLDLSDAEDKEYLKYCLAAAEGGCADAANEMGNICHRKGFYEESTYWYGMAYCLEHPGGITSMRGITKEWAQQGISKEFTAHIDGFSEEMNTTARKIYKMFIQSLTVEDMDELMTLAMGGENLAGFILARIMEQQNHDDMAYTVYNTLAFENHPHALRCYADMLLNGKSTARDIGSAFQMYEMSAKGGNSVAMFAMGLKAFKEGDALTAAAWFGMAYSRGMEMAGDWLAKLKS